MNAKILWIERSSRNHKSFVLSLQQKGFNIETVPTGRAAITRLPTFKPDLVVVNAASMRTNGQRICNSIHKKSNNLPILLISSSELNIPDNICANIVLCLPFTTRKLLNRIIPLIPLDGKNTISKGPIRLDTQRKLVHCQGKGTHLTPRLIQILQYLMKYSGKVVKRKKLFRHVWDTEYTEDTRTLDVHISWLRQAIEKDPREPKLLKTVRGVGYILDT